MTEVGMALSCGLDFADRVDASVGWPLPSVQVRLVDVDNDTVVEPGEELNADGRLREGEIQLRGPTIFSEYWHNPTATATEFADAEVSSKLNHRNSALQKASDLQKAIVEDSALVLTARMHTYGRYRG